MINEFETYSYPETRPGHNEYEDPVKDNDHSLDALRYCLMMATNTRGGYAVQYTPGAKTLVHQNTPGALIHSQAVQSTPSSMKFRGRMQQ